MTTEQLELSSTAFEDGATIPRTHTCDGENMSPPLAWSGAPESTVAYALTCDDPDADGRPWSHWVLYNISADRRALPGNLLSGEALFIGPLQGVNDFGEAEYGGPCPPPGKPHRYVFRLYALDAPLDLPPGATRQELIETIEGHLLGRAELTGLYERNT
jgi:Raf kinase inhibitor-like YbhB/YbcL family protein